MRHKVRLLDLFFDTCKVAPKKFCFEYACTGIDGVATALIPVVTEYVFSQAQLFAQGDAAIKAMIKALGLLLLVYVLSEVASGISSYYGEVYADLAAQNMFRRVNSKTAFLPNLTFEDPETLNLIQRAYSGAAYVRQLVNVVMDIFTLYIPYFLIYGIYLYTLRPLLLAIIPLTFVPTILSQLIKAKLYLEQDLQAAPLHRKEKHYLGCLADSLLAKETRTLGAAGFFLRLYQTVRSERNAILSRTKKRAYHADIAAKLLNLLGYAAVLLVLVQSIMGGYITVAAFAAVYTSASTLIEFCQELVESRIGELSESYGAIKGCLDYLNLPEESNEGEAPGRLEEIQFRNVHFSYPSTGDVLKNISFTLRSGETLALVGENGSGKTTLTKLLLGLYPPSKGNILRNGIPFSAVNTLALQKKHSAVFQVYGRYPMTVRENICLSDRNAGDGDILAALQQTQMTLPSGSFPSGLDTLLSREFGGVELSGGQWQRIAIARGLLKKCQFLVLDEPTSAIDPMEEYKLYQTFLNAAKGKIAVIVTHRLGLARSCDKIAVLKDGELIALDTHDALLETCGYYAELWNAQAGGYAD